MTLHFKLSESGHLYIKISNFFIRLDSLHLLLALFISLKINNKKRNEVCILAGNCSYTSL